jgi:hypothetical protein
MAIESLKLKMSCENCGDVLVARVDTGMADLESALVDAALSSGWHYDTESGHDLCPTCASSESDSSPEPPSIPPEYGAEDWDTDNGTDYIMG